MGVYQYTDEQTGKSYEFNHAGDAPTDEDFAFISDVIKQDRETISQNYKQAFGEDLDIEQESRFRGGLRRGYQQIKGAVGETVGTLGEETGFEFLEDYGKATEEKARKRLGELSIDDRERLESTDVKGLKTAGQFAAQSFGETLPQLGIGLGAAAAAPLVAGATGVAGFGVGALAAGAASAPILFGNNIQRQEDEVSAGNRASVDVGAALTATFGQSVLEGIADKILLGGALRPIGAGVKGLTGLFVRTGSRYAGGAAPEALTEVGQQMMERAQAGLEIDSAEAIEEYREAAIVGGLVGGGLRATLGAVQKSKGDGLNEDARRAFDEADQLAAESKAADAVTAEERAAVEDAANKFADENIPEIVGGPDGTTRDRVSSTSDGQSDTRPEPATRESGSAPGVGASIFSGLGEGSQDVDLFGRRVSQESDPLIDDTDADEILFQEAAAFERQQREELGVSEDFPSEDEAFEQAALAKEAANSENPAAPKGKAEQTDAQRAAATANVDVSTDQQAAFDTERKRKDEEANRLTASILKKSKDANSIFSLPETEAEDGEAARKSEAGGENVIRGGKQKEEAAPDTDTVIDDAFLADLSIPIGAPIRQARNNKSLVGTKLSDEATIKSLENYASVTSIPEAKEKVTAFLKTLREAEQKTEAKDKQVIPGYIYPTDPVTLETGKPYPESDTRYAPVQRPRSAPAELEPSAISTAPEPLPPLPTIEVLLELGVSQGTAAYKIAENRLAKSIEAGDRDAVLADRDDILAALKKYKPKDAGLRARVAEYVAKVAPKEDSIDADIKARDAAQQRERAARLQQQKDNEAATVRREEAKAVKAAMDSAVSLPDTSEAQPVSEADAQAKRIADAEKASKGDPNRPSVILGNKSTSANVDQATDNMLFEEFVRNNTYIIDPISKAKVRPRTSQALSPAQLTNAAQEFAKIQNAKKAVAREQRTDDEVVAAAFKKQDRIEAARVKAFEGWLKTREQDAKALSDAELLALRKEFDDDVLINAENGLSEFMPIPIEYVVGLDYPLDATTLTMLEDNNLGDALRRYADTAPNPRFAAMAKALARVAGNTRVVFADVGDRLAGAFDPKTNTIVFNTNVPLTGHTLLHEMLHAATSSTIANNPSAAPVKAIERIYNEVRDSLPSYYGSSSLLEFVAEAFSNPKFQQQLTQLQVKGKGESAFSQFKRAIARIARSIFNVQIKNNAIEYKEPISALDELELQIGSLLAPAPQYRNAEMLFNLANNPKQANKAMNSALRNGPAFSEAGKEKYLDTIESTSKSLLSVAGETSRSILLKATPLHYLVQIGQKYFPDGKTGGILTKINFAMNKAAGELQEQSSKTQAITDELARWANKNKKLAPALNRLFNESTLYQVDPELNEAAAKNKYGDGTEQFKQWQEMKRLAAEINRNGANGMKQYRQVRNFFRVIRDELRAAMEKRLTDAGIDDATKKEILDSYYSRLTAKEAIEPYFPLTRKGNYWVKFKAIDPNTQKIEFFAESFESEAEANRALKNLLPELVQGFLNSAEGKQQIDVEKRISDVSTLTDEQIAVQLIGLETDLSVKDINFNAAPPTAFVNQLMNKVNTATNNNPEMQREISELILNTLPETSFLQSFRQRKGGEVAQGALGYNPDAITSVTDRARSITRQLVQMKYNGEFGKLESDLKNYFDNSQELKALPFNEKAAAAAMYKQFLFYTRTGAFPQAAQWSRLATGVAFNMTLGFNVSGGLVNLSQIPLIALPYLGGRYGYGATSRAMKEAMAHIKNSGRTRKIEVISTDENGNVTTTIKEVPSAVSAENIDFDDPNLSDSDRDLKELIDFGTETGQFRRTLDHEILDIDKMSGFWAKFNKASGFFLFHGERMNREVSLIAAYKLKLSALRGDNAASMAAMSAKAKAEFDKSLREQAAVEAVNDAEMMNGGLAAGAAPELGQQNLGRIVFMYKRYGVSMLSLLDKLRVEALRAQSKEARRIAAYQLAGIYGSAGVLSGIAGMPLYGMVSLAINAVIDDEDDPMDDVDTIVRTYLGEGPYRGALNYVTGINFASRVGLGELLFRDTFVRSDAPMLYQALEYGGGPLVGIFAQTERAAKLFGEGEFYRGFEAMSPAALKNAMKAFRYATEGVETVGGDKIIEDLHPAHVGLQFFGFAPAEYSRQLEENSVLKGADRATMQRRKKILDRYFRNYFDGVSNRDVAELIAKYNADHPQYPITAETLMRSYKSRQKGKQSRYHGVTFSPRLREKYMEYAQEFDKKSSLFM
jgi:hypothetical protein